MVEYIFVTILQSAKLPIKTFQGIPMNFSNLSFRKKIFSLLALPMVGFLWLSISSIIDGIVIKNEMSTIAPLTELSVVYSELVHELQKERGMTAGFLGSKGTSLPRSYKINGKVLIKNGAKKKVFGIIVTFVLMK